MIELCKIKMKRLVEVIKRMKNPDNFFMAVRTTPVDFYLPIFAEHISNYIITKGKYYEEDTLNYLKSVTLNPKTIIDVGANIGNHSLYFLKEMCAEKVYAFEPQTEIFNILKTNLEYNSEPRKFECYNVALGKKAGQGELNVVDPQNLGATSVENCNGGSVEIRPLDSYNIEEKVTLIKIDVEGFELKVLQGAKKLIKKNHPLILIEVNIDNREKVERLLTSMGYKMRNKIDSLNELWL